MIALLCLAIFATAPPLGRITVTYRDVSTTAWVSNCPELAAQIEAATTSRAVCG
jgi:hypothetical protein